MKHDEFIGQVQARARLDSRGAAEAATRATLETLTERVNKDAADNLAAQLPPEIGEHLRRVALDPTEPLRGEPFGRQEFVRRVAERSGADEPTAAHHVRVVCEVAGEATTGGALGKVLGMLPSDIRELATAGSDN